MTQLTKPCVLCTPDLVPFVVAELATGAFERAASGSFGSFVVAVCKPPVGHYLRDPSDPVDIQYTTIRPHRVVYPTGELGFALVVDDSNIVQQVKIATDPRHRKHPDRHAAELLTSQLFEILATPKF